MPNLAAELTYGTLRRVVSIDWALERATDRPLRRASKDSRTLLRLGAYQLLFTRIPDHAAVSGTVELASPRDRGFVNAVLRRIAREGVEWPSPNRTSS